MKLYLGLYSLCLVPSVMSYGAMKHKLISKRERIWLLVTYDPFGTYHRHPSPPPWNARIQMDHSFCPLFSFSCFLFLKATLNCMTIPMFAFLRFLHFKARCDNKKLIVQRFWLITSQFSVQSVDRRCYHSFRICTSIQLFEMLLQQHMTSWGRKYMTQIHQVHILQIVVSLTKVLKLSSSFPFEYYAQCF